MGVDLPVAVGDVDLVEVDQGQAADPAADQRLGSIAADPAEAEHGHGFAGQAGQAVGTIQELQAGKAIGLRHA